VNVKLPITRPELHIICIFRREYAEEVIDRGFVAREGENGEADA
jgi:hypothetical protein